MNTRIVFKINYKGGTLDMFNDNNFLAPISGSNYLNSIFEDFNSLFKSPRWSFDDVFPPLNCSISTDDKSFFLELALVGYKKEWLSVEIDGSNLLIKAEVPKSTKEDKKYFKQRIKAESFSKTYRIPEGYDEEKAEVSFEDGLLTVNIPIKEIVKTSKSLEIK